MSEVACDFLLFVATPTEYEELELVASEMGLEWESRKSAIGKFRYLGVLGGARVVAVRTDIGPVGVRGSTRTANFYLAATQAQGLVCLGMAFGISRELQKPGTVLVSESMFPYDRRTVVGDHGTGWRYEYDSRSTVHRASSVLVDLMRRHHVNVSRPHAVEFGCLLSGSARIQCARYRDALVAQALPVAPGIVGGEMEGVGATFVLEALRGQKGPA